MTHNVVSNPINRSAIRETKYDVQAVTRKKSRTTDTLKCVHKDSNSKTPRAVACFAFRSSIHRTHSFVQYRFVLVCKPGRETEQSIIVVVAIWPAYTVASASGRS